MRQISTRLRNRFGKTALFKQHFANMSATRRNRDDIDAWRHVLWRFSTNLGPDQRNFQVGDKPV
jgi:hypothetical protein